MTLAPPGSGISAKVAECEFLGSHTRYRVQVSGHALVVDTPHRHGMPPHQAGTVLGVLIDPKQVSVLR